MEEGGEEGAEEEEGDGGGRLGFVGGLERVEEGGEVREGGGEEVPAACGDAEEVWVWGGGVGGEEEAG